MKMFIHATLHLFQKSYINEAIERKTIPNWRALYKSDFSLKKNKKS